MANLRRLRLPARLLPHRDRLHFDPLRESALLGRIRHVPFPPGSRLHPDAGARPPLTASQCRRASALYRADALLPAGAVAAPAQARPHARALVRLLRCCQMARLEPDALSLWQRLVLQPVHLAVLVCDRCLVRARRGAARAAGLALEPRGHHMRGLPVPCHAAAIELGGAGVGFLPAGLADDSPAPQAWAVASPP